MSIGALLSPGSSHQTISACPYAGGLQGCDLAASMGRCNPSGTLLLLLHPLEALHLYAILSLKYLPLLRAPGAGPGPGHGEGFVISNLLSFLISQVHVTHHFQILT